jgi:hypothetical protein
MFSSRQWLPAFGHSGDILLGARKDVFDLISSELGTFFVSMVPHHHAVGKSWEVIGVYGKADHSLSSLFLDELSLKVSNSIFPLLIGRDFNLLHSPADKNNANLLV